jgi:IstB-like ATP binding protein
MSAKASELAVLDEVVTLCRRLRLKYVRQEVADVVLTARAQRWGPAEALRVLLVAEAQGRDRSTVETRRRRARFPAGKTFESWSEARSSVPSPTQRALRSLEWVSRAENVVVAGPHGRGQHCALLSLALIKQSNGGAANIDTQAFSLSLADVHRLELTPFDLVQHGLAGHPERLCRLVEPQPPFGDVRDDLAAQVIVDHDPPRGMRHQLFTGDEAPGQPSIEGHP